MAFFNQKQKKTEKNRRRYNQPNIQPSVTEKKQEEKPTNNLNVQDDFFEQEIEKVITDLGNNQDKSNSFLPPLEDKVTNIIVPKTIYKPLVDKKLTIILVENTVKVAEKSNMLPSVKRLVTSELVSIINYGSVVRQSDIVDVSTFNENIFLYDDIGDDSCLYDALVELENLVSKEYHHIKAKEKEHVRISKIDVICIGTCTDNCSKASKEVGIDCFCRVASNFDVVTKCFCLTDENFTSAAEIGFHSIGAIIRNY